MSCRCYLSLATVLVLFLYVLYYAYLTTLDVQIERERVEYSKRESESLNVQLRNHYEDKVQCMKLLDIERKGLSELKQLADSTERKRAALETALQQSVEQVRILQSNLAEAQRTAGRNDLEKDRLLQEGNITANLQQMNKMKDEQIESLRNQLAGMDRQYNELNNQLQNLQSAVRNHKNSHQRTTVQQLEPSNRGQQQFTTSMPKRRNEVDTQVEIAVNHVPRGNTSIATLGKPKNDRLNATAAGTLYDGITSRTGINDVRADALDQAKHSIKEKSTSDQILNDIQIGDVVEAKKPRQRSLSSATASENGIRSRSNNDRHGSRDADQHEYPLPIELKSAASTSNVFGEQVSDIVTKTMNTILAVAGHENTPVISAALNGPLVANNEVPEITYGPLHKALTNQKKSSVTSVRKAKKERRRQQL